MSCLIWHNKSMHYKEYKTILSSSNGMNLYRGCSHGCIYCDSRSECYQINHDFEDIEVKQNAIGILDGQLRRKRKPAMIGTGSMCDPYMHIEEDLKLTRESLLKIEKHGFGVTIITKSSRILRDLDILKAINERTKCVIQITLTTHDEELCKKLEPNVSTTFERYQVLKAMQKAGIPTIVWMCPILPFINDTMENLNGLMDYCTDADVKGILNFGFGVTLRKGDREYFYSKLDELFPGMKEKYIRSFGNSYICNSPNNRELMNEFIKKCNHHSIIHNNDYIFTYLNTFESKEQQISFL